MSTRHILAAGLLCFAAACGTTIQYTSTNPPPHKLRKLHPDQVQVFTSSPPSAPFVEIGIIQARQSSEYSVDKMPDMIRKLRAEAARIGCEGLIINGGDSKTVGRSNNNYGFTTSLDGYWGACIVFAPPPTPAPAPPAAS